MRTENPCDVCCTKLIDKQIAGMTDWSGALVARLRKVIRSADPTITEEFKWNCPVFVKNGNVCSIGSFKDHVKVNFFKGTQLTDPKKLKCELECTAEGKFDKEPVKNVGWKVTEFQGQRYYAK